MNIAYYNGKKINNLNQISIYNASFLYGINCFEGIRGYWNPEIAKMNLLDSDKHFERLDNSISHLRFNYNFNIKDLKIELHDILYAEKIEENVYIRITIFVDGETSWSEQESISRIISIRSISSRLCLKNSITMCFSNYRRISNNSMPPSVKAGANYLNSRYALLDAIGKGYDGAIFISQDGFISESTGSCIFFIKNNVLYTPNLESDILASITRERIIIIAKKLGIITIEKFINPDSIRDYDSAFLVGTMIELQQISQIDNYQLDLDNPVFLQISLAFEKYVYGFEI